MPPRFMEYDRIIKSLGDLLADLPAGPVDAARFDELVRHVIHLARLCEASR